jgi:hypothetical protein
VREVSQSMSDKRELACNQIISVHRNQYLFLPIMQDQVARPLIVLYHSPPSHSVHTPLPPYLPPFFSFFIRPLSIHQSLFHSSPSLPSFLLSSLQSHLLRRYPPGCLCSLRSPREYCVWAGSDVDYRYL